MELADKRRSGAIVELDGDAIVSYLSGYPLTGEVEVEDADFKLFGLGIRQASLLVGEAVFSLRASGARFSVKATVGRVDEDRFQKILDAIGMEVASLDAILSMRWSGVEIEPVLSPELTIFRWTGAERVGLVVENLPRIRLTGDGVELVITWLRPRLAVRSISHGIVLPVASISDAGELVSAAVAGLFEEMVEAAIRRAMFGAPTLDRLRETGILEVFGGDAVAAAAAVVSGVRET